MTALQNFDVRRLAKDDIHLFQKLVDLFREVFEDDQPQTSGSRLPALLQKSDFIAYTVLFEQEVIGGLTAYQLTNYYSGTPEIFIYDIAVSPNFQRKGIGKMLLHQIMEYCRAIGAKEIFVMAHAEDQEALEFYRKTGGEAEAVINFIYKPIQ